MTEEGTKVKRRRLSPEKVRTVLAAQRRLNDALDAFRRLDGLMPRTTDLLLNARGTCEAELSALLGASR